MAKLVLDLDIEPALIDKIKNAAKERKVTVTEYAVKLFKKDVEDVAPEEVAAPFVIDENLPDWIKSLTMSKVPTPDFDAKKMYGDHIMRKYGV